MAKPTGGLISFGARGQLAKTVVYSTWRGRDYVRRYTIPANPQSSSQTQTRSVFSWLQQVWKLAPTIVQAPWTAYARGLPLTNRNAFGKANISPMRTDTDLSAFIFSNGAGGGLACDTITVTPGATQLTVAATVPTAPSGWTLVSVTLAIIQDQDPHSDTEYQIQAASVASPGPYTHDFTGLTTAQLYRAAAWPVWTKPDGSTAYGPGLNSSGTPT